MRTKYDIRNTIYIIVISLFFLSGCKTKTIPQIDIEVDAKGAVILEADTGVVLFEKDPDKRYPPASTAKVMTAIVGIENVSLSRQVEPTAEAVYVEPTIAGLKPGVKYQFKDLLAAILIKSANDAARVIAEEVAGSEKEFVVLMNDKAKEIGMENTYFASASGLPTGKKDSQYTTARDLAKMMQYASRYSVIIELMSKKETVIQGDDGRNIYLKTHNKSLFKDENAPWGKTGYTREARRTFAGIDPSYEPKIAFGVLKSTDLWVDIATLKDKGLEIYDIYNQPVLTSDIIAWLKEEVIKWIQRSRQRGREQVDIILSITY